MKKIVLSGSASLQKEIKNIIDKLKINTKLSTTLSQLMKMNSCKSTQRYIENLCLI